MKFKPGTILTLVSLTITLFLIGFYLLILAHLSKLEVIVNEKTPFVIELSDSLAQPEVFLMKQDLKERSYVLKSSLEFISKEDGIKLLEKQFGKAVLSDSTSNPLHNVIRFRLDSDFIEEGGPQQLIREFAENPAVIQSYFEEQEVLLLKNNLQKLNRILLITGLIFVFISVMLIYNNLKLVLRSDRFMLKTMELVGASPSFIKLPYIKKSLQIGLLAGMINLIVFGALLIYLNWRFEIFEHFFDKSLSIMVLILIFFIGIFFPLVFSNILVNNYIRMPEEKRYK